MQKLPKNPTKICGKNLLSDKLSGQKTRQKIFYDFFNKKPAKNLKYIQKLYNFTKYQSSGETGKHNSLRNYDREASGFDSQLDYEYGSIPFAD